VAAVSADKPADLRKHVAKMGWKLQLLADPEVKAIDAYGLKHQVAPNQAISRPAELLVDPTGTVRWVDLTDDLRVRTRPETVLEAFDRMAGGSR
jgi:peroxiredoxin